MAPPGVVSWYTLRAMTGSEPDLDEKEAGEAEEEEEELDSSPDSEDPERDSDEPPEPVAEAHPQPDEDRWGIGSRVLALSALLGSAMLVWTQFAFRSRWIADFLESNKLEAPGDRVNLVAGVVPFAADRAADHAHRVSLQALAEPASGVAARVLGGRARRRDALGALAVRGAGIGARLVGRCDRTAAACATQARAARHRDRRGARLRAVHELLLPALALQAQDSQLRSVDQQQPDLRRIAREVPGEHRRFPDRTG